VRIDIRSFLMWALVTSLALVFAPARADSPTLAGTWSGGGLAETVNVPKWVDDCGPKPKAGGGGAGSYKVTVSGDELIFSGPHSFRTDQCYEQGLARRVSHSATPSIRWWKTRCESTPGDPRKAAITTVVRAVDDNTLVMSESAHYSMTVSAGECTADFERSRTFKILAREGAVATTSASTTASATASAAPSPTPTPTPTPTAKTPPAPPVCETLGDPATLEVRPKRKIIRPGEQFDFRARVLDSKGCELSSKVTFRLAPESSALASTVVVDATGRVKVRADAEPVAVAIVVEGASKMARVELEVVSDQRYAELLGTSGFDDAGVDDQAVSVIVSGGGVGGGNSTLLDPPDDSGRKRFAYLTIAGGACMLLALAGLVLWRRGAPQERRRRTSNAGNGRPRRSDPEPLREAPPPIAIVKTSPRSALDPPGSAGMQTVVGGPDGGPAAMVPRGRTCPTCGALFPTEADFCPNDGTKLVPSASEAPTTSAPTAAPEPTAPGRICPVCGKRYPRDAAYCGKDGVELVPLN